MTTSSQPTTFERFIQLMKEWLTNLGINVQLFEELAGDESLPMMARTLAVGVLVYPNTPVNLIPNKVRFIGLIDDMLVMIVGLAIIAPQIPEDRLPYYRQKYEVIGKIQEYEAIVKSTLGILWDRLVRFVRTLENRSYKGKTTEEVAQSDTLRDMLFDEAMIFVANLGLDPESMDVKLLPSPEKIMGLLSSGLEQAKEYDS